MKRPRKIKKRTLSIIKKISAVVVLIAVLTVVLYFGFRTLKPERVIASVNNEVITNKELDKKYAQLPYQYQLFISKDDFLDKIIDTRLLLQEAKKKGIAVSKEEIERELGNLKEQAPTDEVFEDLLKKQDITLDELKKKLEEQLMIDHLLNSTVTSKIGVSESKIKEYYKNNGAFFEGNNITYTEAKEQIREILLNDLSNSAIGIYVSQLRLDAVIIKEGVKVTTVIETFEKTGDSVCKKDNKLIIRLFSTTKNSASEWISSTFDEVALEYKEEVVAYHWQLDTGDNLLTDAIEHGIPKSEVELFQKYNPKNSVPTYVFGCKYVRIGNAYPTLKEEKEEFKRVIEMLTQK